MTDPVFDKEGNLTNLDELDRDEVAVAYQEKNKSLFGRVSEAEAKLKQVEADKAKAEADLAETRKASVPPAPTAEPSKPEVDVAELKLIARGLSDEEINEAKDIARGKGITLTEALDTAIFKLFQANMKEEKRKEDAKLPASKGSGSTPLAEGIKEGMSPAEHKEAWKQRLEGK
jgi:hypothetical protein